MLWWLYETYQLVVGTRTIRRVFERKGDASNRFKKSRPSASHNEISSAADQSLHLDSSLNVPVSEQYHTPYSMMAPSMTPQPSNRIENQLAQALQQTVYPPPPQLPSAQPEMSEEMMEDEESLQLQLRQIALEKREVELKLKMRRLHQSKSPGTPSSVTKSESGSPALSSLYKPVLAATPGPPKRDSRSKKKIEESRKRTAERQERMLRDLERRSRRRDHLTAEWVDSKDIWPLRAQSFLAQLMHQYGYYGWSQSTASTFEEMYHQLYTLVDVQKDDWRPEVHDEMLRERMKRKMAQLRSKMQKTGEIIGRGDAFGTGWQKAEDFTGPQAGDMDDESELDLQHDALQSSDGALGQPDSTHTELRYEPVPDSTQQQLAQAQLPYGNAPLLHHPGSSQYPILSTHHGSLMPYGQLPSQPGLGHDMPM